MEYVLQMDHLLSKAFWHSHTEVGAIHYGLDAKEKNKIKKVFCASIMQIVIPSSFSGQLSF